MRLNKHYTIFLLLLVGLASCSDYQKVLKSDDTALKYTTAKDLFEKEEYQKAILLIEDILPYYRASKDAESLYFMYAYCQYSLGNNIVAAGRFKTLYDTYPYGQYAEQSLFNYAYCNYLESPPVDLDQSMTRDAIESLQLYINKFPNSDKIEQCNTYIDELNQKLEDKAVYIARLYYKIEDYKAAITTLSSVLEKYPLINSKPEIMYLILDSYFELAQNSIESKKFERLKDVIAYYQLNKEILSTGKYASQAANIVKLTENQIKSFNKK